MCIMNFNMFNAVLTLNCKCYNINYITDEVNVWLN